MANINLNVSPYFDDFDPEKDYLRVLFRPGFPVQARELTTLQAFLSEQIERFGQHVFRDGSRVTNAEVTVVNDVYRMRLTGSTNIDFPLEGSGVPAAAAIGTFDNLEGKIISNLAGTVRAMVVPQPPGALGTSTRGDLYIKYLTAETFENNGGYILAALDDNVGEVTPFWNTFESISPACLGYVASGIFFVQGNFSRIAEQTVVISSTSNTPTTELGMRAQDVIITQNEDASILDNARGSSNEGAPGAHRYTQELVLITSPVGTVTDPDYYRILTVVNGRVSERPTINPEYEELGRTLARRTFDESGHYSVRPFSHTTNEGDSERVFTVQVGASKAYVSGYEVNRFAATDLVFDKGLDDVELFENQRFAFDGTTNIEITGINGILPGFLTDSPYQFSQRLQLRNAANEVIGVARAYAIDQRIVDGSVSVRLHMFDIRMFTVLEFADPSNGFVTGLETGFPVENANGDTGFVHLEDGNAGITNGIVTLNTQVNFTGQTLTSSLIAGSQAVTNSTVFSITEVDNIVGNGGFSCTANPASLVVSNSGLLITDTRHIQTFRDEAGQIRDNVLTTLTFNGDQSGGAINPTNGSWRTQDAQDAPEIDKTLNFAYMKIKQADLADRNGATFGWLANDRLVSLFHTDIHRVYGVNETLNSDFNSGFFRRIVVGGAGANQPIPQGSFIIGEESGTRAIVALQNSTANNEIDLSNGSGTHITRSTTGINNRVEVVYLEGTQFTTGEALRVEAHGDAEYTYPLTFESNAVVNQRSITGSFYLDDGQRGEFYDIGRLVRKANAPAPQQDIIVFFSYFDADETQTSSSSYYSADSYNVDFFDYDVRYYGQQQEIIPKQLDTGRDLRNSIDFRLRAEKITDVTLSPFAYANRSFQRQTRVLPNTLFTTDFYEYLGRIDLIQLSRAGQFVVTRGVPASSNPKRPKENLDSMTLSYVIIPPAVRYPDDEVFVEVKDNRRYTMRDIGRIDARLKSLESAVALSILESQALNDDVQGRAKLGFVTDDFATEFDSPATAGDRNHPEFFSSVDTEEMTLLPPQTDGIDPEMSIATEFNTKSGHFTGWIIPNFTEETFIDQSQATGGHRINPFAVWTYEGAVTISPSMDTFRIRRDSFFTRLNGRTNPVSESELRNFQRLTVNSPGGVRSTTESWVGGVTRTTIGGHSAPAAVKARVFELGRQFGGRRSYQEQATIRSRTKQTTVTFTSPRSVGNEIETLTGSTVIQNNQEYEVRSQQITFNATNLRRNTVHNVYFAGQRVASDTTFTTDEMGTLSGSFFSPTRVKVGDQIVELRDAETDGGLSNGSAVYKVTGHEDSFSITQNLTTTQTTRESVVQGVDFSDPVAQLFILPLNEDEAQDDPRRFTSIVSSIDLWFSKVDIRRGMNKVIIEIREGVNGYPGGPDRILGTTGEVYIQTSNEIEMPSTSNLVNFKFRDPVVLKGGTEYAVVIKSPSEVMEVFVATLGDTLTNGSGIHDRQPQIGGYAGSFFISQNSSTWEPSQNVDLTFRLNRCNFTKGAETRFTMQSVHDNEARNGFQFPIGMFNQGLSFETFEDSNFVLVRHPFHGLNFTNALARFQGLGVSTLNSIPVAQVEGVNHDVLFPTLNSYFIKTTGVAQSSGIVSSSQTGTFAGHCHVFDSIVVDPMFQKEDTDTVTASVRATSTNSIDLEIAGTKISNRDIRIPTADIGFTPIEIGEIVEFEQPKIIRNGVNATGTDLLINYTLIPGTIYSAPFCRRENNLFPFIFRNVTGNFLTASDIDALTVRTPVNGDSDANESHASYIAAQLSRQEHAAYVTKEIELEIPADGLTVHFDADMEPGTSVELAYKIRPFGDADPFDSIDWVDFPTNQQVTEENYGMFSSLPEIRSYTARVGDLVEFAAFKVRIRMRTPNEAQIPRVKDLRIIADV